MKKSFFYLFLMIPALISIKISTAANIAPNVQVSSEPAVKEVSDVSSDDYSGISNAVKQTYGTWRQQADSLESSSDISDDKAKKLVFEAIFKAAMDGDPSPLLSPDDELMLMQQAQDLFPNLNVKLKV